MFDTLGECVVHLKQCKHLDNVDLLVRSYQDEVMGMLKRSLLDRMCEGIEHFTTTTLT